jgi:hypothetical protein
VLVVGALVLGGHHSGSGSNRASATLADLESKLLIIERRVEGIRHLAFTRRPLPTLVSGDEVRKQGLLELDQQVPAPQQTADDELLKLLGLIPPGSNLRQIQSAVFQDQVAGFYDPATKRLALVKDTGAEDESVGEITLAHELTHALDDQLYDIDGTLKKAGQRTDAEFAYDAVVEGNGTVGMTKWRFRFGKGIDPKAMDSDLYSKGLDEAPQVLWKPLIAVYLEGSIFLTRAGSGVSAEMALDRAFQHPPRSSEQILHPEKYWDSKQADEPRSVAIDTSKLAGGWKVLGEDTLGEIYLAMATTPPEERKPLDVKNPMSVMGIRYTNTAAEGWGGDEAVLLEKAGGRVLWLVTAWDRPEDAEEFRAAADGVLKKAPGADRFRRTVDRPEAGDVVVVRVVQGVDEKDVPKPTWKVGPRIVPEDSGKR